MEKLRDAFMREADPDKQKALGSASLTEERDLHALRGKREPERLEELALRDRADLEAGALAEHLRDRRGVRPAKTCSTES